jgi:hypothetical protein
MNTQQKRKLGNAVLIVLAAAGIAQACGKDSGTEPDVPVITGGNGNNTGGSANRGGSGNRGGTSGTDNPGGENAGGTSTTGGSSGASGSNQGGSSGRGGSGGTGNDGGTGNEGGEGPDGCVRNPTAPEDFLNRCTDSRCAPFDNETRIPGFDGTLPDL